MMSWWGSLRFSFLPSWRALELGEGGQLSRQCAYDGGTHALKISAVATTRRLQGSEQAVKRRRTNSRTLSLCRS